MAAPSSSMMLCCAASVHCQPHIAQKMRGWRRKDRHLQLCGGGDGGQQEGGGGEIDRDVHDSLLSGTGMEEARARVATGETPKRTRKKEKEHAS
eukprot:2464227-Rhodomonas_salina.2